MPQSSDPKPTGPGTTGKPRTRILHIVPSLGIGGMEGRIARLAFGLDPERFAIDILALRASDRARIALPESVGYILFPIRPGLHFGSLLGLASIIRKNRYNIVHTHNWGTMFYGVLAAKLALGPKIIHGEHGLNVEDLAGPSRKRVLAQRFLAFLSDGLVPVNGVIAAYIRAHWGPAAHAKARIIPNGVDLEKFHLAPAHDPGVFTVGTVGRQDKVKNLECLLAAIGHLHLRKPGPLIRLCVVGDGPERGRLEALAQASGIADLVEFTGERTDTPDWYARFDVFVNCSVYEGMSNTILEAMACGLPVAASRVAGNTAWLDEHENALFFSPKDAGELADKLHTLATDPQARARMGARNRARVEADYDNRLFLGKYTALYQTLA
jgi:glycosyltransferase involved in cell wall biosynthesis